METSLIINIEVFSIIYSTRKFICYLFISQDSVMTKFPIISLLFPTAFRYHRHTLTTDKHKEGETGPAGGCGCFQGSPTYSHHRQLQGGGDAQLEGVVALRDHRHTLATDKHKEEETGPAGGCGCFEGSRHTLTTDKHR